jgi:DNA-binding LytR/AlgR family response regulator
MDRTNILIVEDDPIIAADLQDRLEEMGYRVLGPVAKGEEALNYFGRLETPDLVLMDIQLEGAWDGIETTKHIKAKTDLPIIFLTSNSDDATFQAAKQVKPHAFLSKPFRGRDLKHSIELAISLATNKSPTTQLPEAGENAFLFKDRLFIKSKDQMVRLFFKDILWVEADDYYCKVVTAEREYLVTQTLKKFSEELAGVPELMRVHRSFIVNLSHVEAIGELNLQIGKTKIQVSRNMRDELLNRLKNI